MTGPATEAAVVDIELEFVPGLVTQRDAGQRLGQRLQKVGRLRVLEGGSRNRLDIVWDLLQFDRAGYCCDRRCRCRSGRRRCPPPGSRRAPRGLARRRYRRGADDADLGKGGGVRPSLDCPGRRQDRGPSARPWPRRRTTPDDTLWPPTPPGIGHRQTPQRYAFPPPTPAKHGGLWHERGLGVREAFPNPAGKFWQSAPPAAAARRCGSAPAGCGR